jgi:iron-sulfur cluster assembly protein
MITVSEKAAERIQRMLTKRGHGIGIRLGVNTRGCSGMSYVLEYVDEPQPGDDKISDKGVTIFVDPKSTLYLLGTQVDWQREGLNEGFKFVNPNEKGTCGCGESFHI